VSKPSPTLEPLVRNLELRAELSEEDRRAVLDLPFTPRIMEAASYLVREGEPPLQCGVLLSGFAYRQKLTGDGDRQIVALHLPGEAVDFQNTFLDVADHNVQMLTRGEVAFIPRDALRKLVNERPAVSHAIFINTLVDASIFREWVLNVGRRDGRSRTAHVLCEFAIRLNAVGLAEQYGYDLPMTQEQLADTLGMTPVHVNRILKSLEADHLISRSKRKISFPDWERLREVADFNERFLHLDHHRARTPINLAR
jgi:CRP-like cAMP-binding protein